VGDHDWDPALLWLIEPPSGEATEGRGKRHGRRTVGWALKRRDQIKEKIEELLASLSSGEDLQGRGEPP
jgi:hypothetical protein